MHYNETFYHFIVFARTSIKVKLGMLSYYSESWLSLKENCEVLEETGEKKM